MVTTREVAEEYRLTHWAQVMKERTQRGLSIREFCKQIGICENTYFYWQRRVRKAACEQLVELSPVQELAAQPNFVEIEVREPPAPPTLPGPPEPEASSSQLCIEVAGMRITADSTYPPEKLAALLRELTRPC